MERKNLKVYEVLLIGSVLLHWLYTVSIDKLVAKGMVTNPDVIFWTAFAISLFFFTMVIITIQALIHNLMLLQTPQTGEEKKGYKNMIVLVLTLLIFVVTLVAVGTKDSSSNSASTYTPTLMKSNKVLRQEAGTQPVEEPVEWVEDTAIEKREQRGK